MRILKPKEIQKALKQRNRNKIIKSLDNTFSKIIRTRDKWTCQRCGKQYTPPTRALHNSHYWGRTYFGTRWSKDNCVALCYGCHRRWEGDKQGAYKDFMHKRLPAKMDILELKARGECKFSRTDLLILEEHYEKELKEMEEVI